MATIVEALLSNTISELEDIATLHIAALHLFPGGGLSHGAGIGARMGELFLQREGFSVVSVDIDNAFNSTITALFMSLFVSTTLL